jgi:hypothetical protein
LSQEELWEGARDLLYLKPPGSHRRALWKFCTCCWDADCDSFAQQIEELQGEGEDINQVEQMWLDAARTPQLTVEQQVISVRVLRVYCARQRSVHQETQALLPQYVQGMHMLTSCPLKAGFSEAEVLLIFESVLNRLVPYYQDTNFERFKRDSYVMEMLISEVLPYLKTAMHDAEMPIQTLLFDPLLCLFSIHTLSSVALRIWDMLLIEGDYGLFSLTLVLLKHLLPETSLNIDAETVPIPERFNRALGALSDREVEPLLAEARTMLEGPGPLGKCKLQERIDKLRVEAENHAAPWWDQALVHFRSLW